MSGPRQFIHYNGRDYTPLEFQEYIAANLPGKMNKAIKDSLNSLRGIDENIAGFDRLIELTSNPQDKQKYAEYRERRIIDRNRELAFLKMLLATENHVNDLAVKIGQEVDSLK